MSKLKLTKTARFILEHKEKGYLRRDKEGNLIETAEDMLARVSDKIASADLFYGSTLKDAEKTAATFYDTLTSFDFLPTTCILRNAGRAFGIYYPCAVLPLEDDLESIYKTLKDQALVQRGGAGVGYDFSRLRPEGDVVHSTGKTSSGPISFMKLFDFSSEEIQNRAAFKHAAHMGVLRVDHPDIEKFITAKLNNSQLTNFNLSVAITDDFMEAYTKGRKFGLINPRHGQVVRKVSARKIFNLLSEAAWKCAEPGVIFIDEINRQNQVPGLGRIEAVNLCGEQPLFPYETCVLGSLKLNNFIRPRSSRNLPLSKRINWRRLEKTIVIAIHFLDNAIDLSWYPVEESRKINRNNRRVGLGVVGWADLLVELGIRYGSRESLDLAGKLMKFINEKALAASGELGERRGNFPNFEKSIYFGKVKHLRNCARTTIAPTGHLSLIAGVGSGIEPYFSFVYERKEMETIGESIRMVHEGLRDQLRLRGLDQQTILQEVLRTGSLRKIAGVPDDLKEVYVAAMDVSPGEHIRMQAAFQKYVDNAVAKTVNLPHSATVEDIKEVYLLAHRLGCKGLTVYRDRSRECQVLNLKGEASECSHCG